MGVTRVLVCVVLILTGLGSTGCICSVKSMETGEALTVLKAPPAHPDAKVSVANFVLRSGPQARYGTGYGYRYDVNKGSYEYGTMTVYQGMTPAGSYDRSWPLLKDLREFGFHSVTGEHASDADYYVAGQYSFQDSSLGWAFYDLVVFIPACFLPIPIGDSQEGVIELAVWDSSGGQVGTRKLYVNYKKIGFSAWGLIAANNGDHSMERAAAVAVVDMINGN